MREQSIFGDGQASVARNQIAVAINQTSIQAEQLHSSVQSSSQEFETTIRPWEQEAVTLSRACQTSLASLGNTAADAENPVCERAQKQVAPFQAKALALRNAFAHVESVWVDEHPKQVRLSTRRTGSSIEIISSFAAA